MKKKILIKNMVCNRCKSTIYTELKKAGFDIDSIELGQVILNAYTSDDDPIVESLLKHHGFEIIKDETDALIEHLKMSLIKKIESNEINNLSTFLSKHFNKSYSALSKLFSKKEGITIEKYLINLKIERVKELIQLGQLNFSEIAYALNYNNSSHLSRQFKTVTGMSMSSYRLLQNWDRKTLDQII
ncbi:DNA-binding transcriptional regulator AraC [Mariniflexile rhizosphaerae]|uniref:helix-turn-helix domain-containing protein n=1 Tax=unclassified Mariniflexile TaxID=2643887 RepID=UPI000CCA4B7F|nr:helix-turn-helix transcriptional regulator [Mariniflexile sp. TRM1-10]AXP82665.1 DNA-binding transcriptional regulator AraC [Mariniflexile sp. TRM1-10]PLB18930.1 MAG: Transcriptional regulator, AraC family [Flavobacteriaceae bacterium FS1-H7996/R]